MAQEPFVFASPAASSSQGFASSLSHRPAIDRGIATARVATIRFANRRVAVVLALLIASSALSGCASLSRNAYCALAGAGAGAAGGIIYGVNEDSYDSVETMGVTVGGAAAGALLGYGVCAIADLVE